MVKKIGSKRALACVPDAPASCRNIHPALFVPLGKFVVCVATVVPSIENTTLVAVVKAILKLWNTFIEGDVMVVVVMLAPPPAFAVMVFHVPLSYQNIAMRCEEDGVAFTAKLSEHPRYQSSFDWKFGVALKMYEKSASY